MISSPALLEDEIRDCEEKEVPFLYTVPLTKGPDKPRGTVTASWPANLSQGGSSHIQVWFLLSWTSWTCGQLDMWLLRLMPHMSCFPPPPTPQEGPEDPSLDSAPWTMTLASGSVRAAPAPHPAKKKDPRVSGRTSFPPGAALCPGLPAKAGILSQMQQWHLISVSVNGGICQCRQKGILIPLPLQLAKERPGVMKAGGK